MACLDVSTSAMASDPNSVAFSPIVTRPNLLYVVDSAEINLRKSDARRVALFKKVGLNSGIGSHQYNSW